MTYYPLFPRYFHTLVVTDRTGEGEHEGLKCCHWDTLCLRVSHVTSFRGLLAPVQPIGVPVTWPHNSRMFIFPSIWQTDECMQDVCMCGASCYGPFRLTLKGGPSANMLRQCTSDCRRSIAYILVSKNPKDIECILVYIG